MPSLYQNDIKLRLDSNIIFFHENGNGYYELYDIFAVKGGPPIKLEIGTWNLENGIALTMSTNRWDILLGEYFTAEINVNTDVQCTTSMAKLKND